jgi:DNA repair exonuclease SbcCD ATPase subunit
LDPEHGFNAFEGLDNQEGMMPFSVSLMRKLDTVDPGLKEILWALLDEIEQHREQSVTKVEFNELKDIVRELAEAQKRTEQRVEELTVAQKELAEAQKRTEQRVEELAEAQKQTEKEIAKLSRSLGNTRSQVGGLARSMAYALENEAYRKLPAYLKTHCQLEIHDRFIRTEIGGEEINLFAKATRDGEDVVVVGETVLRLDDRSKMKQLEKQVTIVRKQYHLSVVPLVVTHFARATVLEKARKDGVIVVQTFEWE